MRTLLESGGPAFPTAGKFLRQGDREMRESDFGGMTLRDYFAAAALTGLLIRTDNQLAALSDLSDETRTKMTDLSAAAAYRHADAMLEARK